MKYLSTPWGRSTVCSLALVIVLAALVAAQDYRAKIQGVVEDAVNAAIPNAKVVLKNDGTGVEVTRQAHGAAPGGGCGNCSRRNSSPCLRCRRAGTCVPGPPRSPPVPNDRASARCKPCRWRW